MLYIILISASTLIIALVNILCNAWSYSWWYLLLSSVIATIAVIGVDGLFAFLIRRLPEKWFTYDHKIFNVSKKEASFYKAIRIKKWKDKIPELGGFTSFHKDKVYSPSDPQYIERFLLEIDYGWMIHITSVPFGFLIMLLDYHMYMGQGITIGISIGIPVAIINGILNLLPAFILRYNYPRLLALLKMSKRSKKSENGSL